MSNKNESNRTLPLTGDNKNNPEVEEMAPQQEDNADEVVSSDSVPNEAQEAKNEAKTAPLSGLSTEMADRLALEQYEAADRAGFPTAKILQVMGTFAAHCVQSGQTPATIDTPAKMIMTFQAGREMGIPPMKALYSFYFVNNKLTMYGPTVIERIRSWATIEYGECNAETATVTITRKDDGTSLSSTVTMKELEERGTITGKYGTKDTFKKHPRTMLIYKAVGEIVRHIVPEAVGGVAVEGDWGGEANDEISNQGRRGKILGTRPDMVVIDEVEDSEIPSVPQIIRNYQHDTLQKRAHDMGLKVPKNATKQLLATAIHDALVERQNAINSTDEHDEEETKETA